MNLKELKKMEKVGKQLSIAETKKLLKAKKVIRGLIK